MYWRKKIIGIRQKFGKERQLISFGGSKCQLSYLALQGWGEEVLKHLDNGMPVEKAKASVLNRVA